MGKWTIIKSAEHRAIVRAPRSKKRNIGEISEYSKEEAEIGTLALGGNPYFRKRTNPEWPSARRGEGSRRERVARKMTINNWYNAARPSFRRRRRAPLPLPVCLSVCLSVRRSHCYCKESGGRANGGRESEGRERETRSVIVRRKANAIAARSPAGRCAIIISYRFTP